jgi:hypothetical protein
MFLWTRESSGGSSRDASHSRRVQGYPGRHGPMNRFNVLYSRLNRAMIKCRGSPPIAGCLDHIVSRFMSIPSIEERVATLEREIAELKRTGKNWRQTIGMFTDNSEMLKMFDHVMKLREKDRMKARRSQSPRRRSKA